MKVTIAQLAVSNDVNINLEKVLGVLRDSTSGEWVLFPEGMISGYYPEEDTYLSQINEDEISKAVTRIEDVVKEKNCYCLIGSALKIDDKWFNCTLFITPERKQIYKKII